MTWSRICWTGLVSVLLVGLAQTSVHRWIPAEAAATGGLQDPRCVVADRANVALIEPILARNGPSDIALLERAVRALNAARRHCQYGWVGAAVENYDWLKRWLEEQR
jgi:hypothetical protein